MRTIWAPKRIQASRRSSVPEYPAVLKAPELSRTSSNYSAGTNGLSVEEVDCFRSMRGTSIESVSSLESAMSQDLTELDDRLASIRNAGEREKKVFDKAGQAYSILVTHDEVRVCHMDEKGEYHYRHLPNVTGPGANSRAVSGRTTRRTSNIASENRRPSPSSLKKRSNPFSGLVKESKKAQQQQQQQQPKAHPRRQVVQDSTGKTLVDIAPDTVTVYHRNGVWRCHRFAGKIWDSDYATHVTARIPRPWEKLRRKHLAATTAPAEDKKQSEDEKENHPELLLCSNTPGERGPPPRAYKSYYHDL